MGYDHETTSVGIRDPYHFDSSSSLTPYICRPLGIPTSQPDASEWGTKLSSGGMLADDGRKQQATHNSKANNSDNDHNWSEIDFVPLHGGRPTEIKRVSEFILGAESCDNGWGSCGIDIRIRYYP